MFSSISGFLSRSLESLSFSSSLPGGADSSAEPRLSPEAFGAYLSIDLVALLLRTKIIYSTTNDALRNPVNRFNSGLAAVSSWVGLAMGILAIVANAKDYLDEPDADQLSDASSIIDFPLRLLSSYNFLGFITNVLDKDLDFEGAGFTRPWRFGLYLSCALVVGSFVPASLTLVSAKEEWSFFSPQFFNTVLLGMGAATSAICFFVIPKYVECAKELDTTTLFLRASEWCKSTQAADAPYTELEDPVGS